MPIFVVVLEPANSSALWFWHAETCSNGSHSCQGSACPVCSNARGNLWELSTGNKDRNHVVLRKWRSILFVEYTTDKGPPSAPHWLLAGGYLQCLVTWTFPKLLHALSKSARESILPRCSTILCNLIMEVSDTLLPYSIGFSVQVSHGSHPHWS